MGRAACPCFPCFSSQIFAPRCWGGSCRSTLGCFGQSWSLQHERTWSLGVSELAEAVLTCSVDIPVAQMLIFILRSPPALCVSLPEEEIKKFFV